MCKYCEKVIATGKHVKDVIEAELMETLPIIDGFNEKPIENDGNNPVQYIRKYENRYSLITEFADDEGTILLLPINNCPMCGRTLTFSRAN